MERRAVSTDDAPKAIGPYSQAIVAGDFLFCSGQIPLDPKSGEMVGGDDVRAQARQVMDNLSAVLAGAGSGFDKVVKATVYLTDLGDFQAVNEVYGGTSAPSRPPAPPSRSPPSPRAPRSKSSSSRWYKHR